MTTPLRSYRVGARALLLWMSVASMAGCFSPASEQCTSDTACAPGACVEGRCTTLNTGGGAGEPAGGAGGAAGGGSASGGASGGGDAGGGWSGGGASGGGTSGGGDSGGGTSGGGDSGGGTAGGGASGGGAAGGGASGGGASGGGASGGGASGGGASGGGAAAGGGASGGSASLSGDTCSAPIAVAAPGVVMGSTALALPHYGSGSIGSSCLRADGRDVVYEVAIPAATRLSVTVTPLTSFDVAVNLVADAAACGTPAGGMQCLAGADSAGASSVEQLSFTNAGAARTALLVVDGYGPRDSGSFALSVVFSPITTGDTCEAPTTLTAGTPLTNQLLTGFMDDYGVTSSGRCQFHSDADRVYAVQVPSGQRLSAVVTPSSNFDPSLSLLTNAVDCAAGVCVNGIDDGLSGEPERLQWDNLAATAQTVLLVVDAISATGSFTIAATLSASPPVVIGGDTCAAPTALDAGTFVSSTAGRASRYDFFDNGGCAASSTAPDGVFALTVPPSSMVRATVTPDGWDAVLNVISSPGACGFTTDAGTLAATCLTSSDGPRTASVEEVLVRNVTSAATTALLVVDGHGDSHFGAFTIATEVVPLASMPGDVCQAPQPITTSGSLTGLTTASYLNDVETASSCTGFQNRGADRVFSITVPAGKQLTGVVIPNGWDASLYVIDPGACSLNTTCLDGSDSSASGAETVRFTNASMTDRTVYLVVDSYSSSGAGGFDLFTSITP